MRLLTVCLLLLGIAPAFAKDKTFGSVTVNKVTSIYDADTFRVNIEGWPAIVGERISIRVLGIDAPELRGKCQEEMIAARKAKQFTVTALRTAKNIELRNIKRGKYFRILADVYIDNKSLATELIKNQLARKYDGEKVLSWCN